jgi:hypothetical protein
MIGSLVRRAGVPAWLLCKPRTFRDDPFRHFCTPRGDDPLPRNLSGFPAFSPRVKGSGIRGTKCTTTRSTLRCPQVVADNAAKGLRLRKQFGRGGTEIGVARATELKNREKLAPSTIRRMVSYFARHEVDKRGRNYGNEQNPSAGYIAWLLWGGDEGRAWALALKQKIGNAPDI